MEIIGGSILALSIISVLWQLVRTRRRARNGKIIVPPFFAGLLIFSLFVLGVVIFGVSPIHLMWLFPVSYGIGTVLLFFPVVQKIVMTVANSKDWEEEEKGQVVSHRGQKQARRPSGSNRRKRYQIKQQQKSTNALTRRLQPAQKAARLKRIGTMKVCNISGFELTS